MVRKWEVDLTLIEAWIDSLDDKEYDHLIAALEQLEEYGPVTRRPFVDTLEGSAHPNMKELRPRTTKGWGPHPGAVRLRHPVPSDHARCRRQSRKLDEVVRDEHSCRRPPVHRTPREDEAGGGSHSRQAEDKKGEETMTTLDDLRRRRPGNRARIDAIKDEMDREVAQYRLRELREDAGYTQTALAAAIGVGQNRVSQMEHGNLGTSRVDTLRKYVEATGGELEVAVKRPDGSRVLLNL
jgi:DNA-binding XRE family transcriptional regulator